MKDIKNFILVDIFIFFVKILGGLLCHSYSFMASAIYDLAFILVSLLTVRVSKNKKGEGIFSSFIGILIILLGLGILFVSFINEVKIVSFFILLFVLLSIVGRYVVSCFSTNSSYQKKKGLLSFGIINSTLDFIQYGVIVLVLVFSKLSRWVSVFQYVDRIGTLFIVGLVVIKGIKVIVNSLRCLEDKEIEVEQEESIKEISLRDEVRKVDELVIVSYGGIRKVTCSVQLKEGINIVDINTFVVTLQDYLLKIADVVLIYLVEKKVVKKVKPKVRSLKQDARNSRSGNGKTNTKKKNIKQKNKKR